MVVDHGDAGFADVAALPENESGSAATTMVVLRPTEPVMRRPAAP
jgi:hypothetical protein